MADVPGEGGKQSAAPDPVKAPGSFARFQLVGVVYEFRVNAVARDHYITLETPLPNPAADYNTYATALTILFRIPYRFASNSEAGALRQVHKFAKKVCEADQPYEVTFLGDILPKPQVQVASAVTRLLTPEQPDSPVEMAGSGAVARPAVVEPVRNQPVRNQIGAMAMTYHQRGWSVVPQLAGAKKPCVKWKPFQDARPTLANLDAWFKTWPQAGIAVVLGPVSALLAIDVDGEAAHQALLAKLGAEPKVPKVLSGSGEPFRYHLFFLHPKDVTTFARITPWHPHLEFRGHRGIVVLPPSVHQSGKSYAWAPGQSLDDLPLVEPPAAVLDALKEHATKRKATILQSAPVAPIVDLSTVQDRALKHLQKLAPAVAGAGGDKQTFRAACDLVLRFNLSPVEAFPLLAQWNRSHCQPPWSDDDLRHKLAEADKQPGPRGKLLLAPTPAPPESGTVPDDPSLDDEGSGSPQENSAAAAASLTTTVVDPLTVLSPSYAFHDRCFIDSRVLPFFERIIPSHGLFKRLAQWPWLSDVRKTLPAQVPGFEHLVENAECEPVLQKVFKDAGGMLCLDENRQPWALALSPGKTAGSCLAVGFCVPNTQQDATGDPVSASQQLQRHASTLRLAKTARTVLWLAHAALLRQGQNPVVLADIACGEAIWGLDRSNWPKNWRRDLLLTINSLRSIHWRYVTQSRDLFVSFPLAHPATRALLNVVDDRKQAVAENDDGCPAGCPYHAHEIKHHHLRLELGPAFLGDLTLFSRAAGSFDFHPNRAELLAQAREEAEFDSQGEKGSQQKEIVEAAVNLANETFRRQHKDLVPVPLATLILGGHANLPDHHRRILCALVREVTRSQKKQQNKRPDAAHVIENQRVPGKNPTQLTACLSLRPHTAYIGFNGNSKVWGIGYRIATWMHRCGYLSDPDQNPKRKAILAFLKDLGDLAKTYELNICSLATGTWCEYAKLLQLGEKQLRSLTLRVYTQADYLERWRQLLAAAMAATKSSVADSPKEALTDLETTNAAAEDGTKEEE